MMGHARVMARGLAAIAAGAVVLGGVILVFAALPAHLFGEVGAVAGAGIFTLIAWGYIIGLFIQLDEV